MAWSICWLFGRPADWRGTLLIAAVLLIGTVAIGTVFRKTAEAHSDDEPDRAVAEWLESEEENPPAG